MFVHLHVHSPFSFLDGASGIEDLVAAAARFGMPALALTDHNSVGGAARFHRACTAAGLKPIQGAEITLDGGFHLVLLADGPEGYANLCRLLTAGHLEHPRGNPRVGYSTLGKHSRGLFALSGCRRGEVPALLLARRHREAERAALRYRRIFGRRFYLELVQDFLPGSRGLNCLLVELGEKLHLETVATNNVHYADRDGFPVHDLLTCVRTGTGLEAVHPERRLNAENHLKAPAEMHALFRNHPRAPAKTLELAEACRPALDMECRRRPRFPVPEGESPAGMLRRLTYAGAGRRYGRLFAAVTARLEHELAMIERLEYEDYFLVAWDAVRYAAEQGIRFAGRGSAADSAVAYCLGVTEVDSVARGLLFERFLSPERAEAPDIDIDFDARYRDQVSAYVCARYGAEHTAWVCTYNTYRARAAVRDLGKVLDFPEAELDRLAKLLPHVPADGIERALDFYPELHDPLFREPRYRELYRYCAAVAGFPRFLGTHLGGVIISGVPLATVTPLQRSAKGVVVAQFDKDDVEDLDLLKFDLLSLRTLGAVEETVAAVQGKAPGFAYDRIPEDDPETFAMFGRGETVGVFQLESPAQRALQARLRARNMEDVIAGVALIRPGPVKGNMVEPYIARRQGTEPVSCLHPRLAPILEKTYGVVLFQEQVLAIATALAGFTPGEADRLRRAISKHRSQRDMDALGAEFVAKAAAGGVAEDTARGIFDCLRGYAGYGFCEAHAAAFAVTAYRTGYLARHHPAEYFAALLSNQPLGYYSPRTLCTVARSRGVGLLPPDVNRSGARFTVEEGDIRVPLSQVRGMAARDLEV
ncbi:MAG: DNA polymerase III subunit alpha, partial [Candidatus Desulforudis sp.]|nr:DNA polymerase III subunit alpha [Desulforudis sp.]